MTLETKPSEPAMRAATRKPKHAELFEAATEAYEWLCDAMEGTDPYERGEKLRKAMLRYNMDIKRP